LRSKRRSTPFSASDAIGLGQSAVACPSSVRKRPPFPSRYFPSTVRGLAQLRAAVAIAGRSAAPEEALRFEPASDASGAGQEEHSLAPLGRSDLSRAEHVPLRIEPETGQVPENLSEGGSIVGR
jgi:hypothetical protein